MDYFPIYWKQTRLDGGIQTEIKVLETKKCAEDGEEIIIPLRTEVKEYFDNGTLAQSSVFMIDPENLKVNHKINDQIFTMPVSEIDRYWDADFQIGLSPKDLK